MGKKHFAAGIFSLLLVQMVTAEEKPLNARIAHLYYSVAELENLDWEGDPKAAAKMASDTKAELTDLKAELEKRSPGLIERAEDAIKSAQAKAEYPEKVKRSQARLKIERVYKLPPKPDDPNAKFTYCMRALAHNLRHDSAPSALSFYDENNDGFAFLRYRGEDGMMALNDNGFAFVSTKKAAKDCAYDYGTKYKAFLIETAAPKERKTYHFHHIYRHESDGSLHFGPHAMRPDALVPEGQVRICDLTQTKPLTSEVRFNLGALIAEAVSKQSESYRNRLSGTRAEVKEAVKDGYAMPEKPNPENYKQALSACEGLDSRINMAIDSQRKFFSGISSRAEADAAY